MSSFINQPMDKFFKQSMAEQLVALDFFKIYLPPRLLKKMDLTTLKLEKHSFIDEAYKAIEADVVYSVRFADTIAYLYLLCEQQSEVNDQMAFRLLEYSIRIMKMHSQQFPKSPLPLIYPLVVYSGEKPWNAPLDIFPLFGEAEATAREWLFKPYQLVDIYRTNDQDLRKHQWCGLMEFALKHREARDLACVLETLFPWLGELQLQDQRGLFLGHTVLYFIAGTMQSDDTDLFLQKADQYLTDELRGAAMTLAQQFEKRGLEKGIQQGLQQGIQQGMQQGMQQGLLEGEKMVLLRQIQRRFGEVPAQFRSQMEKANAETVLKWADAFVDAYSIEEIFE